MSSEPLYVEFADGAKLWGIYYGAADAILQRLFDTRREVEDAFFCEDGFDHLDVSDDVVQNAQKTAESVKVFTIYGSYYFRELEWDVMASRIDKVVIGPYTNPAWNEYR